MTLLQNSSILKMLPVLLLERNINLGKINLFFHRFSEKFSYQSNVGIVLCLIIYDFS